MPCTNMIRLQRDAEYFQSKLSKIDGFGDLGERLLELVKQKSIATEAQEPSSTETEEAKGSSPKSSEENKSS